MDCKLSYIPHYLHLNNKPIIDRFNIGEELYYRCSGFSCKKPYDQISLYDISHNRNFSDKKKFPKEDVLLNIEENQPEERYDSDIVTLRIDVLGNRSTFVKKIISRDNEDLTAEIKLIHDPLPCMYPHSVFEVSLGGEIVTRENYKSTLGKSNRTMKNLRSDIRQELTSIIQTGSINSAQEVSYITDL